MITDQLGNSINLEKTPKRIISLVPSQTELLYHLGLEEEVVGITKFCIHPKQWFHSKERVGGPKKVNINKVKRLSPDLIIGNKEENVKEDVEALRAIAPVWLSDIFNLDDALAMITKVSSICGKEEQGRLINSQIRVNFEKFIPFKNHPKVIYMIWKDPYMAVASNTFIHHILTQQMGFVNVLAHQERYPELDMNNLPDVDYVLLSTEPYPFKEKHIPAVRKYFPNAKILIVDGEHFTWYGSRLINAPKYFDILKEEIGV